MKLDAEGLADSIMSRDKKQDAKNESDAISMAAGELLDAIEKKDKAGVASALRAASMACMDEYGGEAGE